MNSIGVHPKATPLEFLQAVFCNEDLPLNTRIKAAVEALPFVHPKLAMTAMIDGRDFGAKLERAIERSNGRMIEEPKLVEQRSGKVERLEELDL
jgi:hypothetical protein